MNIGAAVRRAFILAVSAAVLASMVAAAPALAENCGSYDTNRQAFFGDLHVHTRFSFDAFPWDPPNGPREAYEFARNATELPIPPRDKYGVRLTAKINKRLDFTAVTDHAEGFGETATCMDQDSPAYNSPECILYRGEASAVAKPDNVYLLFGAWFYGDPLPTSQSHMSFCQRPDVDCEAADAGLWQVIRDAAEEFNEPCDFTTFVGYEWTGTPLGANIHRNVIFRNANVPDRPISKMDTGTNPVELWKRLDSECRLKEGANCDVLVIPHNSNLSAGQQFLDPASSDDAKLQKNLEPLIEIMQVKGSSECRLGYVRSKDQNDSCDFELLSNGTFFPFPRPPVLGDAIFGKEFAERSFVRNVLEDGLKLGRATTGLGVNPWRFGFVGATDTHFGTPGNVYEKTHQGTHPSTGSRDELVGEIENNPGGLTVVWAEENSRDSIFEALRRRETYATSGTRPIVRVFGGWSFSKSDAELCGLSQEDFAATGDQDGGVRMGGILGGPQEEPNDKPRFAVSVWKDLDETANLQVIQIVKGWVDSSGQTHEKVYDVTGNRQNGASVDSDCNPDELKGNVSLCTVWTDDGFDRDAPAFWYVRVLENPTCRWSTYYCRENGVDPLNPATCKAKASAAGEGFDACCEETSRIHPLIQERAWTSPIWYKPEGS